MALSIIFIYQEKVLVKACNMSISLLKLYYNIEIITSQFLSRRILKSYRYPGLISKFV